MSKYKVLAKFKDLQDKNKIYNEGDSYPSTKNKKVTKARIEELSTNKNKLGKKLIEEVEEKNKEQG